MMSINPIHSEQSPASTLSGGDVAGDQLVDQIRSELVQMLVTADPTADASPYPWNSYSPEADPYLARLEQYATWEGWDEAELSHHADSLASYCGQLWTKHRVLAQFAERIPAHVLDVILCKAQATIAAQLSLADRLVACVQDALPTWAGDDLYVLARPLAYAMRGDDASVTAAIAAVNPGADWAMLSDTEQARLSLAVARQIIDDLDGQSGVA
jgi:hypothetical protein